MRLHSLTNSTSGTQQNEERIHVLSHELRTPLAVISGYAQVLDEELTGEQKQLVHPILENVERLQQVISSIIDWEVEVPTGAAVRSNCCVRSIVDRAIEKQSALAEAKNIPINVHAVDGKVAAYIASSSLESSVNQLLHNALKFSDSGSIEIQIDGNPQQVCIRIKDCGPGISDTSGQLFEPFVQGSRGLNRKHDGLGLGLALVKKETARLGGSISLSNRPSGGAVAELRFPRFALNTHQEESGRSTRIAA